MRGTAAPPAELQLYTDNSIKQVTGLEPVTPLRQSGALANYAIPAYKSFPVGNVSKLTWNQQPADYKSAALPLRQRSMIGAAGIEPTSTVYKTAALPLDEAPLKPLI